MNISLIDPHRNADHIRRVRTETVEALGLKPIPAFVDPLDFAVYLAAYSDGGETPFGLAEAYFHDQSFRDYGSGPFASFGGLPATCPFERMSHMRTIFVEPERRRRGGGYLFLYLAMSQVFREMGASHATMITADDDADLARLYEKTGGTRLGEVAVPGASKPVAAYVFDLARLLLHPLTPRMTEALSVNRETLAAIRAKRKAPR